MSSRGTPGISCSRGKWLFWPLKPTSGWLRRKKKFFTGREGGSLVVDMKKLASALKGFEGIAEGHVLCELSLPATAIVLRASPAAIRRRLAPRRYSKQKVCDNVEAEALDYCAINALENYKKVIQVDTTGLCAKKSASKALRYLKTNKSDRVDWSDYFLR